MQTLMVHHTTHTLHPPYPPSLSPPLHTPSLSFSQHSTTHISTHSANSTTSMRSLTAHHTSPRSQTCSLHSSCTPHPHTPLLVCDSTLTVPTLTEKTQAWVDAQNYLTQHQSLSSYVTKTGTEKLTNKTHVLVPLG